MSYFVCNGVKLFYEEKGNPEGKETIGFLNGVMASTSSWAFMLPVFEQMGFRIILHDFMGQLKSDKPDREYTFEEHCEQARLLYDWLGVNKIHLIGTSYGGEIALRFALMYPDFVSTISIIDSLSELNPQAEYFVSSWKTLCDTGDGEVFFNGMTPSIYGPEFIKNNKEMLAERAKAIKGNPDGYLEGQKRLYDTFLKDVYITDRLGEITCPALILCGENDILKPPYCSRQMWKGLPNAEFMILPECGHVSIFERPNEMNSAILGFILKNSFKRKVKFIKL